MENLVVNHNFWKNKTVLLTGHTGFKGSWMSLLLQKLKTNVIGYSLSIPTKPSLFEIANVEDGMTSVFGDIGDYHLLQQTVKKYCPDIVIHMAAQPILLKSYHDPLETFETNVMGTIKLLNVLREQQNHLVILNVTSDKCYMISGKKKYEENDQLGGLDPYSCSKSCSELITTSFRRSFFNQTTNNRVISIASARSGNVIGGGDWGENRLIPDVIRAITNRNPVKLRNLHATRPWQYVLDALGGYMSLLEKIWSDGKSYSGSWNFGPIDEEKSVKWIVDKLRSRLNFEITVEPQNLEFQEESHLSLDVTKASTKLGWQPKYNIESALEKTISWYENYFATKNMRTITEQYINEYLN